jgi:hypothetical protein
MEQYAWSKPRAVCMELLVNCAWNIMHGAVNECQRNILHRAVNVHRKKHEAARSADAWRRCLEQNARAVCMELLSGVHGIMHGAVSSVSNYASSS